ncbi:MAG: low molecular weight protein-tyrosine-phosphatase [Marinobacter sp.]|uniref:low molecular weight protein-tyrosine-phosphatase n=1 Tax=Marinobacter sp. TaxID=50741 RepID=UPI00299CF978|nr:low molecular weight protein-tyrosine-phosphatase [Marinobacter sp.]MDX1633043.1 low molecular weight protein-tyrosine-phosphatase [Marinobacter sp.]
MTKPVRVLFVCLGNICRSPTAEGVFRHVVTQAGLADRIHVDSCGTADFHVGEPPDRRSQAAARSRGIDLSELRARQLSPEDLKRFDYVLVMDRQNLANVRELWHQNGGAQPELFLSYADQGDADTDEVPDPYHGGEQGFERVFDLVQAASEGLLRHIRKHQL